MLTSLRAGAWVLANTLATGLLLLFTFGCKPERLRFLGVAAGGLCLLAIAVWAGHDWLQAESERTFTVAGVTTILASCAVLIGMLTAIRSNARDFDLRSVIGGVAVVSAWIGVLAIAALLAWDPIIENLPLDRGSHDTLWQGLQLATAAWFLAVMWRLGRIASIDSPKRIGGWLAVGCLVAGTLLPSRPMFDGGGAEPGRQGLLHLASQFVGEALAQKQSRPQAPQRQARIDVEGTYYRQPELVERMLAGLAPSRPDRPEIYFLAAATFASEAVFMREVKSAKDIVDERFGTKGRSMMLINHRDTHIDVPLANVTNLQAVLTGLARVMVPDKDLLVLYITSHGAPGEIAVQFPGFSPTPLTPARLRRMLDASRIKHKLVVISACYSGSFIPDLAAPDTVVMTAARPDRTSFGCSDERDWTYFGDAFFNHALRQTLSFADAFQAARKLVSAWESEQKFQPSEPQIAAGAAAMAKLDDVARFHATRRTNRAPVE